MGRILEKDLEYRINPEKNRNFSTEEFGRRLKHLARFAEERWPHRNGLRISVVGTNGKGSVCHYLERMLREMGKKTGLYTSPHLHHFSERIRINGKPVSASLLEEHYLSLKNGFSEDPELWNDLSYFELLTLLSIEIYQSLELPVQIYEAGLGGRLDATRLCQPQYVVITKIALDHTKLLGHTKNAIFREKTAIAGPETRCLLLMEARYCDIAEDIVGGEMSAEGPSRTDRSARKHSSGESGTEKAALPPTRGVAVFPAAPSSDAEPYLKQNFRFARWIMDQLPDPFRPGERKLPSFEEMEPPPGRMQSVEMHGIRWVYDSGHNPASLYTVLSREPPSVLVLGILPDRSYRQFLRVARRAHISRIFCINKDGLAPVPEHWPNERILKQGIRPEILKRQILQSLKDEAATKKKRSSYHPKGMNSRGEAPPVVLFTGSYRIYDLFLEILGGDIVHA